MIELLGAVFVSFLGTVGHFLFKWTNGNKFIGFLFSKNESVFEHIKLGITPMLIWMIVEKIKLINSNLISIKGVSFIMFFLFITIMFYFGKSIFKKEVPIYNISLFYIGVFLSYFISFLLLNIINLSLIIKIIGFISFIFIVFLYFYSNIKNPTSGIFKDYSK